MRNTMEMENDDLRLVEYLYAVYFYRIHIVGKMLQWLENQGNLEYIDAQCKKKSSLMYKTIEESEGFYYNGIEKSSR